MTHVPKKKVAEARQPVQLHGGLWVGLRLGDMWSKRQCGRAADERDEFAASHHSITSSVRASSVGGISRPSTFAVVRLMTKSNFVGCSTGMSPGFAPRRILSTNSAARRKASGMLGP